MKQKTIFIVFLVTLLQINDCNPNASQKEETDPITSLLVSSLLTSGLRTSTTTTTGSATTTETGSTSTSTVAPTISTVTAPSTGLPRNIPGAYITVTGIGFVNGSTTVKVNSSTITNVSVSSTTSLQFTMPEFSSINTDTSLTLEITANNQTATATVIYSPLSTLTVNSQYTPTRTLTSTGGQFIVL